MKHFWNRCDVCGRIISYADIASGKACHKMITPDSDASTETWETLCRDHYQPNAASTQTGGLVAHAADCAIAISGRHGCSCAMTRQEEQERRENGETL